MVLTLLLSLSLDGVENPARFSPDVEVPAQTISAARGVLDAYLNDYPRARFRDVRAVEVAASQDMTNAPIKAVVFCGQVNAPNRMGGMTGWVPFYLRPDTKVFPFDTSPGFNPRLHPNCQPDAGTPVEGGDLSAALSYSASTASQ